MHHILPKIGFMFILGLCHGCQPSSPESVEADQPAAPAGPVCIIASGDTEGWIIPCGCTSNQSGGLLRRGTYVQQRAASHEVIVVDVGGAPDGTAPYQTERFRAILRGEALMKIEAHNVGLTEAALGREILTQLSDDQGVSFVSANVREGTQAIARTHVAVQRAGKTFLITGVLSPTLAPDTVEVIAPAEGVLHLLDRLEQKFDHIVVLAYCPADELRQLARTLPEADVIIGGPTGQAMAPETVGHTIVLSATNKGKFLADIVFPPTSRTLAGSIVEMSASMNDHPAQKENLEEFRLLLAERDFTASESGLVDATTLALASREQIAGSAACRECHEQTLAHWDKTGHAHAWQKLAQEGAHVDPYCQHCHTTGYGLPGGFVSMRQSQTRVQVGCESCHGPSASHAADSSVRTPFEAAAICIKCHDHENSPHFEYEAYWEQIRHE